MPKGYLALVLHAHLPFVRHPEHKDFLEEDWLFQAISETYIPLIQVFDRLMQDGVPFQLTMSLSPPLLSMLSDDLLQQRTVRFLDRSLELAEKEIKRTRRQPAWRNARSTRRRGSCCRRSRATGRSSCSPEQWSTMPTNAPRITSYASTVCMRKFVKAGSIKAGWPISSRRTTSSPTSITGFTRRNSR